MKYYLFLAFSFLTLSLQAQRDPFLWPFADSSIWNMPIGANANYVPALIQSADAYGMTVDEDLIVLKPNAPLEGIYLNEADWDQNRDRCPEEGPLLFSAPIPAEFIVSPDNWDGLTPNSGLAVLMPDGVTIKQTQPFARCTPTTATSHYTPPDVNLFGDGVRGAHGGSGLSAIGGTLRLGELDESSDTIRHVLKVNLFAAENLFYDAATEGYRWPAIRADGYAPNTYGTQRINPIVMACRMGALLALLPSLDLDSMNFETIPARILAQAFQDYGAYIVDDTAWDVYALVTEWSPDGRFTDEFEAAWGFPFTESNRNTPWTRDMARIFTNLHVVDNNAPNQIGGGGPPRMPLAPAFGTTSLESQTAECTACSFTVFPNPFSDQISIHTDQAHLQWTIWNWAGQMVLSGQATSSGLKISTASLANGLYFLEVTDAYSGTSIRRKIVKVPH
ncbi:MAG: T9SS type A sorting domain-containing protein [Bacteroidota bacterium]